MAVRQSTIPGASSGGDQENALGDELWNNTWYRPVAPGVITENVFSANGSLTIRGYNADMTMRATGYDHDNSYQIIGPGLILINHDFYDETYTVEFDGNGMRLCDQDNVCAIFKNDPGIF